MFSFLFESRLADITAFCGITEESSELEKFEFCEDCLEVIKHGLASGCLTNFIYYYQTETFFDTNKEKILEYFEEWFDAADLLECMMKHLDLRDIIECNKYAKNWYVYAYVENALFGNEWDFENALEEYEKVKSDI